MKFSPLLLSSISGRLKKEWEVQDAYFAGQDVILSDSITRSNKQWHDCGDKPQKPVNGQHVKCSGAYCAAVCPIGWRSMGRWRVKCQANNTWSHSNFSPCITCPDMSDELEETNAVSQTIFRKNLPVTQFFCGISTHELKIKNRVFRKGGRKRNVKCQCRNGQNGDPAWKKSCAWEFEGRSWSPNDVKKVECRSKFTTTTTTTTTPPCLDTFRVETNYDCQGSNIKNIPIQGDDHRKCEDLCREAENCVGYVWHGRSSKWSECWLKDTMTNCRPVEAGSCNEGTCLTGFLNNDGGCKGYDSSLEYSIETNYDCTGGDISHIPVNGATDAKCQELCGQDDKCVGYTWSSSTSDQSWCHLKHTMVNCKPVKAGSCGQSWLTAGSCYTAWRLSKSTPPNS